jgi:putative inorganic carbon (hco3(-)) transporter
MSIATAALPRDFGRTTIAGVVLLAATFVAAWVAWPAFLVLAALWLGFVAWVAVRWPLAALVGSSLGVLADPVLVRTALPDAVEMGPIGASEPMLAIVGIVIVARAVRDGRFWPALRDPLLWLLVAFVVVAAVSALVNAVPPVVALVGIVMTVDAMAVYFLARMLPITVSGAERAVIAVVVVVLVAAVIGIMQVLLHPDLFGFASFAGRFGEGGRITSFLGNPNMVAAVVGFALPFPLLAAHRLPGQRERRIAFGVLAVFCLALLLTFSRGAWLAVVIGVVVSVAIIDWRALGTMALALALAWLVTILMPRNLLVAEGDLPLYFPESGAPSIIDSTLDRLDEVYERRDLRMTFIREGLPIVADNPILGVGPGRYGGAASAILPSPVYEQYDAGLYGFRTVHNFWLHLFGEVGLVGGIAFALGIFVVWLRFVLAALREVEPRRFVLYAGAATAVSVVTVNNVTEMLFEGNFPGFVFWLVFGAISALLPPFALARRRSRDTPTDASSAG